MSSAIELQKVGFLVGGAQKSGTTALDSYLRYHPQIGMPVHKEVHFFDNERLFCRNRVDEGFYATYFTPLAGHRILGETTPVYMYWYSVPQRVWCYNPDMKWILLLRNPIERAFSHWNMQRTRGRDNRMFLQAIQNEYEKCRESLPLQCREYSYLARGFYTEQIRRILYHFPRQQLFIVKSEDLRQSCGRVLSEVWDFLGVDNIELPELSHASSYIGTYQDAMGAEERRILIDIFEYEIRQLERMLEWDCSDWLRDL